jgi:hypothetical protein
MKGLVYSKEVWEEAGLSSSTLGVVFPLLQGANSLR